MKIRFAIQTVVGKELWTEWHEFNEKDFPLEWAAFKHHQKKENEENHD